MRGGSRSVRCQRTSQRAGSRLHIGLRSVNLSLRRRAPFSRGTQFAGGVFLSNHEILERFAFVRRVGPKSGRAYRRFRIRASTSLRLQRRLACGQPLRKRCKDRIRRLKILSRPVALPFRLFIGLFLRGESLCARGIEIRR